MDKTYRFQRYIYDATRKYFLLGRDRLIDSLEPKPGARILEVGVGTGRNLLCLAKKYPECTYYGLDASSLMLETAKTLFTKKGLTPPKLKEALAEKVDYRELFDVPEGFDYIIFSYAISMIPAWEESLARGVEALSPHGTLSVVDFGDQAGHPHIFRTFLWKWLGFFHVHKRFSLLGSLEGLAIKARAHFEYESVVRNYAWVAHVQLGQEKTS